MVQALSIVGTTQYQIEILPAGNRFNGQPDGPGISLIRNVESALTLPRPVLGRIANVGNERTPRRLCGGGRCHAEQHDGNHRIHEPHALPPQLSWRSRQNLTESQNIRFDIEKLA